MDSEKKNEKKHSFVLSEVIKRKILDMYNISKEDASPKKESENSEIECNQKQ